MFSRRTTKLTATAFGVVLVGLIFLGLFATQTNSTATKVTAADDCQTFDTGYKVCGRFLEYWKANGGLAQQGLPISPVFEEKNQPPPYGDGQTHQVQYFERARFELNPQNAPPYDVLLGLLGRENYRAKYGERDPNAQFFIVRGKRTEAKIGSAEPRMGYTFLVLDLLVTNLTDKKVVVSPASITVRSAQVYDYKVAEATYQLPKYLKLTELQLNQRVGGELAFEVPTSEQITTVTMDYFDNKATINIP